MRKNACRIVVVLGLLGMAGEEAAAQPAASIPVGAIRARTFGRVKDIDRDGDVKIETQSGSIHVKISPDVARTLKDGDTATIDVVITPPLANRALNESVYRVPDLVGISKTSRGRGQECSRDRLQDSSQLRAGEVTRRDVTIAKGKVTAYRARAHVSVKYEIEISKYEI